MPSRFRHDPAFLSEQRRLRRSGLRLAFGAAVGLALLFAWLTAHHQAQLVRAERARVEAELRTVGGALEAAVAQRFALVAGLVAFVKADFDRALDPTHVDPFAAAIHGSTPGLRALQLIRDGVIRYTYPLAGNERALVHDLSRDRRVRVRADYLRAAQSRALEVSGPFPLLQGGTGLVARQTVERDGKPWGLVAMVLDLPALLAQAQVPTARGGLAFALRDGTGQVFFGPRAAFTEDGLIAEVRLPQGRWHLAAAPSVAGSWARRVRGPVVRFAALGIALVVLVPILVGVAASWRAQRLAFGRALARKEVETWKRAIRVIGHEIGNSMTPISSLVHSARLIAGRPEKAPLLPGIFDTIEERARHLTGFLERYAQLARLPPPSPRPVSWERFVHGLRLLYPFSVQGALPAEPAIFDEAQLQQVVINLLKNASEAGGDAGEIQLEIKALTDRVELVVHDRGAGLAPEARARVGEPFFTTKPHGSGLGLLLCGEIVAGHGGTLTLEPRLGGGTSARLSLPRRPSAGASSGVEAG